MNTIPGKINSGTRLPAGPQVWQAGPFRWELEQQALVMGILNVTPDSFSDGGKHLEIEDTIAGALGMIRDGAGILDIGGESTRPGAAPVSAEEEERRVVPVIRRLARSTDIALSIDTSKPSVAAAALAAGAHIVNDVTGLRDPAMVGLCAASDCGVVVMHMQGTPQTMQEKPCYDDVVDEVRDFFDKRHAQLTTSGISSERIAFDPGIGFGKTLEHNLALIAGIESLVVHGRPVLMGLSRKSFIGRLLGREELSCRERPTQALTGLARRHGAMIHRVHKVRECCEALRMVEAVIGV
jgi:dihydropteroate synthase